MHVISWVDTGNVVDAGSAFILLVHAVQPDKVFLSVTSYLQQKAFDIFTCKVDKAAEPSLTCPNMGGQYIWFKRSKHWFIHKAACMCMIAIGQAIDAYTGHIKSKAT